MTYFVHLIFKFDLLNFYLFELNVGTPVLGHYRGFLTTLYERDMREVLGRRLPKCRKTAYSSSSSSYEQAKHAREVTELKARLDKVIELYD